MNQPSSAATKFKLMNTLCEDYRSFFSVSQDTEQQYSGAYSAITAYKSGQNGVL